MANAEMPKRTNGKAALNCYVITGYKPVRN